LGKILLILVLMGNVVFAQSSNSLLVSDSLSAKQSFSLSTGTKKEKRTIAVLDISGDVLSSSAKHGLTSIVMREIHRYSDDFELLDRKNMQAIMSEQGFQQSTGCTDEQCAVEMGQVLGVNDMVFGEVEKIGRLYIVTLKNVDVENGKIENMVSDEYKGEQEGLIDIFKKLTIAVIGEGKYVKNTKIIQSTNLIPKKTTVKSVSTKVEKKKKEKSKAKRRWFDLYWGVNWSWLINDSVINGEEPDDYKTFCSNFDYGLVFYMTKKLALTLGSHNYKLVNDLDLLNNGTKFEITEDVDLTNVGIRLTNSEKITSYFQIDYLWGKSYSTIVNNGSSIKMNGFYMEGGNDWVFKKYIGLNFNVGLGFVTGEYKSNVVNYPGTTYEKTSIETEYLSYLFPRFGVRLFLAGIKY